MELEVGGSSSSDKDDAIVVSPVEPVTPVTPINPGTGARAYDLRPKTNRFR